MLNRMLRRSCRCTNGAPMPTHDEFWSQTSLLLTGNTGVVTDAVGNAVTIGGALAIDKTVNKWPGGCLHYGANAYTVHTDKASLELGTANFTIEFWCRPKTVSGGYLLSKAEDLGVTYGNMRVLFSDGKMLFVCNPQAGSATNRLIITSVASFSPNVWYHIAWTRQGSNWQVYINGVLDSSIAYTAGFWDSNYPLYTGCYLSYGSPTAFYDGYLDELRITKGLARYTGPFTPPTGIFPTMA